MLRIAVLLNLLWFCQPLLSEPLRFGSVAMDTPEIMHQRLTPLTSYLSSVLQRPIELRLSPDMKHAIKEVAENRVDLAYLTPVAYIRSHEAGKTRLLAKTVTNRKDSFQLMIVVREDSPVRSVKELAGKHFAFGDPAALLQRAVVAGAGITIKQLGKVEFVGHYNNIARGVMRGYYDAGILKDTTAYKWKNRGLRVLYSSEPLPPYNLAVSAALSEETYQKLKKAFLALNVKNSSDEQIIKSLDKKYDGFAETSDAEYDIVRKLTASFR